MEFVGRREQRIESMRSFAPAGALLFWETRFPRAALGFTRGNSPLPLRGTDLNLARPRNCEQFYFDSPRRRAIRFSSPSRISFVIRCSGET